MGSFVDNHAIVVKTDITFNEDGINAVISNVLVEEATKKVKNYLDSSTYYNGYRPVLTTTADRVIKDVTTEIIKDHKDEIIEMAADKLADRLARTKAAKAMLEEKLNE